MKRESRREHNPIHVSSDGALEKAEQLAPLEERKGKPTHQNFKDEGVISVDTGNLKLPSDFTERREEKPRMFGVEPIAVVIIIFALAFIAFIAYLISIEPPKGKDEPVPAVERQP
ncbi:MAG: hypothetical protein QOH25_1329 [Acidobacteriota bacterium]|nr:hypothetical protein [Acidobacteriota bacterium]